MLPKGFMGPGVSELASASLGSLPPGSLLLPGHGATDVAVFSNSYFTAIYVCV